MKLLQWQNWMKSSRADNHIRVWKFSNVAGTSGHSVDGDRVISWNIREFAHLDVAVCPRIFYWAFWEPVCVTFWVDILMCVCRFILLFCTDFEINVLCLQSVSQCYRIQFIAVLVLAWVWEMNITQHLGGKSVAKQITAEMKCV